jgi:hypothetical protein
MIPLPPCCHLQQTTQGALVFKVDLNILLDVTSIVLKVDAP